MAGYVYVIWFLCMFLTTAALYAQSDSQTNKVKIIKMKQQLNKAILTALLFFFSSLVLTGFLQAQNIVIKAGHLFNSRTGKILNDQTIIIKNGKIQEVISLKYLLGNCIKFFLQMVRSHNFGSIKCLLHTYIMTGLCSYRLVPAMKRHSGPFLIYIKLSCLGE